MASNNIRLLSAGDVENNYTFCFVGIDSGLQTLLIDLIPGARVLSLNLSAQSEEGIEAGALNLLNGLHDEYLESKVGGRPWRGVTLVSRGIAGVIVKQALIVANSDEKYQELAACVSDLVFSGTPHRAGKFQSWTNILTEFTHSEFHYKSRLPSYVNETSNSFLSIIKRYRIINILEPCSSVSIDDSDPRVLGYELEKNVRLERSLTDLELSNNIDDLECLRNCLIPFRLTRAGRGWKTTDYVDLLAELTWTWRATRVCAAPVKLRSRMPHILERIGWNISCLSVQLVGPVGWGKRTLLRELASMEDKNPLNTIVLLFNADFEPQTNLQVGVLKAFVHQVLWQKPFLYFRLKCQLESLVNEDRWTESSLWILVRTICQSDKIGELLLFVGNISDWARSLRPLLQFLQASSVHLRIISTSTTPNFTELPSSTKAIDMVECVEWYSCLDDIVDHMLPTRPAFGHPDVNKKIHERLQQLGGDYLTATLYLEQVSRSTPIHTPVAIENSLADFSLDREQLYHKALISVIARGTEIARWCSQALSWISKACRPLTIQELSAAVAVSAAEPQSSKDVVEKHMTGRMWETLSLHLGLFLQREDNTVVIVHETAKTSLETFEGGCTENGFVLFSHYDLAILCVRYLLAFLPTFGDPTSRTDRDDTFLLYAAKHWPYHYIHGVEQLEGQQTDKDFPDPENPIHNLLSSSKMRGKWYNIYLANPDNTWVPTQFETASLLGLKHIAIQIYEQQDRFDVSAAEFGNSLILAIKNNHQHITDVLMRTSGLASVALPSAASRNSIQILNLVLDLEKTQSSQYASKDITDALIKAARSGHLEALQMIIACSKKMDGYDILTNLPLEDAADMCHTEIVEYILQYYKGFSLPTDTEEHSPSSTKEKKTNNALHAACKRGNEEVVRRLLESGTSATNEALEITAELGHIGIVKMLLKGHTRNRKENWLHESLALIKASENGYMEMTELLLEAGIPVDVQCVNLDTALHKAAAYGHTQIAQYLVSHGADRNLMNTDEMIPAQLAAEGGHLSTFQAVQEHPQPINYNSYISFAAANGHVIMIRYLLRLGHEPIDGSDEVFESALVAAASNGYLAVIRELCEVGVEVNRRTGVHSALHKAASNGHTQVVEYLLMQGADYNGSGQIRRTPLHESVRYPEIVKMLVDKGADCEATDLDEKTPLHLAVAAKEEISQAEALEESIRVLLKGGANINAKDEDDNTPLHLAASLSFEWAVSTLSRSAKPAAVNKSKATALHLAVKNSSPAIVRELLKTFRADSQLADIDGNTPLHLAARRGEPAILRLLLDTSGSMINAANGEGQYPLILAAERGNKELVTALVSAGANINAQDSALATALFAASARGYIEIVEILLQLDSDTEIRDENGYTPLLACAINNYVNVAKALLDKGADINAVSTHVFTSLGMATLYGYKSFVQLLMDRNADLEIASDEGWTPLLCAVSKSHSEVVTMLIEKGSNFEAANSHGWRALSLAVSYDNFEIVRLLLEKGADIEAKNDLRKTPLIVASSRGNSDIVSLLTDRGANIEAEDVQKWRPLHWAASNKHPGTITFLLDKGVYIDAVTDKGVTSLMIACSRDCRETVNLLINRGANIEAASISKWRALHFAADNKYPAIVKLLIDKGAEIEAATDYKSTPIILAAAKGHIEVAKLLLDRGADIKAADKYASTPIMLASTNGHFEMVKLLLDRGANIEAVSIYGSTPILLAATNGHLETVKHLLDRGANMEAVSNYGSTPIMLAATNGHLEIVKLLLDRGANIEAVSNYGSKPILLAATNGHLEIVKHLLDGGANIEAVSKYGSTPIMLAATNGHLEIVKLLLDRGANIEAGNNYGSTPITLAASSGNLEIVKVLKERGANIEAENSSQSRSLHVAAYGGHAEVCQYLLDNGANINTKTQAEDTVLYEAARGMNLDILRLVLERGADPNVSNYQDFTPLHISIQRNSVASTVLLLEHGASKDCKDICGKTPFDWLSLHKPEPFQNAIPSLREFRPTSKEDQARHSREKIHDIVRKLEKDTVSEKQDLWFLQICVMQLGDMSSSASCMLQRAVYEPEDKSLRFYGACDLCRKNIYDLIYVCKFCMDTYFCNECMQKHKEKPELEYCLGHEYLEIRAAPPYTDETRDSVSTLKALLEDVRRKYDLVD